MRAFVCPRCYFEVRPHAFYFSGGKSWWSVSPAEASVYKGICENQQIRAHETIVGCDSMRASIDRWLRSERQEAASFGSGEVSIASVAVGRYLIEARAEVQVPFSPAIAESFGGLKERAEFERNPGSIEVKGFDLRDVVLVSARMLLFQNGERVAESRYLIGDDEYWMKPPAPRALHKIATGKTVIIGANRVFANYYHWMMQCLPAIAYSVETIGVENCVLALPPLGGWQEESLAILGYAGLPRIQTDLDCHYQFENAHYCTYLNGSAAFALSPRCLDVLDRLAAQIAPVRGAPERLYVARLDSRNRVMKNEAEVRRLLESRGFVTLVPGYYSLRDQIALFESARVVVGPHGAGLTNLAFCQPGITVLELVQSNYPNVCVNRIAQGRGLRYHAECFQCPANEDVHGQDWMVDVDQLEASLLSLLGPTDDAAKTLSHD